MRTYSRVSQLPLECRVLRAKWQTRLPCSSAFHEGRIPSGQSHRQTNRFPTHYCKKGYMLRHRANKTRTSICTSATCSIQVLQKHATAFVVPPPSQPGVILMEATLWNEEQYRKSPAPQPNPLLSIHSLKTSRECSTLRVDVVNPFTDRSPWFDGFKQVHQKNKIIISMTTLLLRPDQRDAMPSPGQTPLLLLQERPRDLGRTSDSIPTLLQSVLV